MNQSTYLSNKLEEINEILSQNYKEVEDIGVLTGSTGIALFHFYYSKLKRQEINTDIGMEIISESISKINEGYNIPTFCKGIAGAAWTIELSKEEGFIDIDSDALLSSLDGYLENSLSIEAQYNFYDFLHGVIGIGYYFLKRYLNTESVKLKANYKKLLLKIIKQLREAAQIDGGTAKWESNLIFEEKLRGYNLSLSHGISSIINFLTRLSEHSDFKVITLPLLQKAINYVLQNENNSVTIFSCFPDWITVNNEKSESARLAWCYGDLGVAISLWKAGKVLVNTELCDKALTILKHTTKCVDAKEARIMDAGLCHGAYGVIHIYNYMYKETQEIIFKKAAQHWLEIAINMAIPEQGYAGYGKWHGGPNPGWDPEVNLLEGISGIGLAIISYIAPFNAKWDECLMIG
ncbi:lanthionine synthetase C family protein [uncultured Lacinutrix sp.]|uniref:lanthionine synthetase C family protein n=1 Tax=uncultured Lacinutrix sp. TaxID=574032 RepID=UPI00262235B4|nr:lanthionine synthetase C family protein [uncultured Lacinutrix sp.]